MSTRAEDEEPALRQLREEFTGHRIWRSQRPDGQPSIWVATLFDPDAGVDATVISPDPVELREALLKEGRRAGGRSGRAW
ncbi:hypothetical protein AGRA3207_003947 [Actinomadura graeca]|uniref:Uncharacterized protein n=1 Tax=Actinomadura graeca TaxID=2750812 RepID=A0ABX8QVY1_9ACTN|nr:hypothetical protein [Actinomadura graeca]QXJ22877.1 hypothetical protein AGRA3207_003947 [Actinomadura graeca]